MLFGPRTSTGQQGEGPGWIRLEPDTQAGRGVGRLIDADGKAMNAGWQRERGDSLHVVAFDDFLRVELHLAIGEGVVEGRAGAHSDATVERDATGRLGDLRRAWRLRAVEVTCDSIPEHGRG